MSRKITSRNPDHPKTHLQDCGQRARVFVRRMSNEELGAYLKLNIHSNDAYLKVIRLTRSQRIQYVVNCARAQFIREFEARAEAAAEAEAAEAEAARKETPSERSKQKAALARAEAEANTDPMDA
jgi:hypothetical protein